VAPHPQLHDAEDRRLVEVYDQGLPLAEILRLTGRSTGARYSALRRRKRRPDRTWENRERRQWYGAAEERNRQAKTLALSWAYSASSMTPWLFRSASRASSSDGLGPLPAALWMYARAAASCAWAASAAR
jgi:hypothetical protein